MLTDIFDASLLLAAVPTYPKTVVIVPVPKFDSLLKQVCPPLDSPCIARGGLSFFGGRGFEMFFFQLIDIPSQCSGVLSGFNRVKNKNLY